MKQLVFLKKFKGLKAHQILKIKNKIGHTLN
jgi:hypothetical protein